MTARQTLLDLAAEDLTELSRLASIVAVEIGQAAKLRPTNAEAMQAAAELVMAQSAQLGLAASVSRAIAERLHCVAVYEAE